jgi:hypothetical protein
MQRNIHAVLSGTLYIRAMTIRLDGPDSGPVGLDRGEKMAARRRHPRLGVLKGA